MDIAADEDQWAFLEEGFVTNEGAQMFCLLLLNDIFPLGPNGRGIDSTEGQMTNGKYILYATSNQSIMLTYIFPNI